MEAQLNNLEKQVTRILSILESDDSIKEKGLVEKVSNIEKILNELVLSEKVLKAKVGAYGVIGGALFYAVIWLAKIFLAKLI